MVNGGEAGNWTRAKQMQLSDGRRSDATTGEDSRLDKMAILAAAQLTSKEGVSTDVTRSQLDINYQLHILKLTRRLSC